MTLPAFIDLPAYFMGRDREFGLLLSVDMRVNAGRTVELANALLARLQLAGVPLAPPLVNSGWRPPATNAATPGAAQHSKHLTCQAVDIHDPDGAIDAWLMATAGQKALTEIGLWMEHPAVTKGWSHWQIVPPNSRNRVFYP
jgi:hypothetical protein